MAATSSTATATTPKATATATVPDYTSSKEFISLLDSKLSQLNDTKSKKKEPITKSIQDVLSRDMWSMTLCANCGPGNKFKWQHNNYDWLLLKGKTETFAIRCFLGERHHLLWKATTPGPEINLGCSTKLLMVVAESLHDIRPNHGKVDTKWLDSYALSVAELVDLIDLSYRFGLIRLTRTASTKLFNLMEKLDDTMIATCKALKSLEGEQKGRVATVVRRVLVHAMVNATWEFDDLIRAPELCWDHSTLRRTVEGKELPKREICKVHSDYDHDKLGDYDEKYVYSNNDYCCSTGPRIPIPDKFHAIYKAQKTKKLAAYQQMVAIFGVEMLEYQIETSRGSFDDDKGITPVD